MTNLRPGPGSCTPNWGTHDDRMNTRLSCRASTLYVSLRHTSDPTSVGLAPGPVTEELTSNPKESDLDCTNLDWATRQRLLRPDDRVKTN